MINSKKIRLKEIIMMIQEEINMIKLKEVGYMSLKMLTNLIEFSRKKRKFKIKKKKKGNSLIRNIWKKRG